MTTSDPLRSYSLLDEKSNVLYICFSLAFTLLRTLLLSFYSSISNGLLAWKNFLADYGIRTFLSTMFLFCFPSVRYRMVATLKCMQYVPVIQKQSYSSFGRQSFYGLWLPICMELLLLKRKPKRKRKQCDHLKGSHRDFTSSKSIQMAFVKTHLSCPLQVLIWQA